MRFLFVLLSLLPLYTQATVFYREGLGSLRDHEGQLLLHTKGTSYERGYQHGVLLKDLIARNVTEFIYSKAINSHPKVLSFKTHIPHILSFIPTSVVEELRGLSEGSEQSFEDLLILNLFPEMFHCNGLTVQGDATSSGQLYHVRALDYQIGKNLQLTAVTMLVEPTEGYSYMSVSYAGFIGCITGMNDHKIALGEIGGQGYGVWNGMPMAFLMKHVLEHASSLEEAKKLFSSLPRTCEYYYLVSDGNQEKSIGIYATSHQIHFIESGSSYALLAPYANPQNPDEKHCLTSCKSLDSPYQTALYNQEEDLIAIIHHQPENALILTGFAHPWRYPHIIAELKKNWGSITHLSLQSLLNNKTTLPSNLHNAIFLPSELKMWVAHAGKTGELAYTQHYSCFDLRDLLERVSFD
jgi:isopenicillin-N N-acyltransferase like protein